MAEGQLAMNTNLASPGLFFKDSNGDLVKTGPVHVGTTAPNASPASGGQAGNSKGELWLDTTGSDYTLKTWDGTAWREIVVTSTMIKDGTIVNADIDASAAIAGTKITAASTSVVGTVQLTDSVSSSSITTAATPASVKSAYDLADAALPKAGGTLTGDVTLGNQFDLRFGEATANGSNYVAFQAPASITADVTWTLPAADGTVGQVLGTNGTGTLDWITAASGSAIIAETKQIIDEDYTLSVGFNGISAGPVEVADTYTVTVPAGATWVIV
jgi:hypothetical protein